MAAMKKLCDDSAVAGGAGPARPRRRPTRTRTRSPTRFLVRHVALDLAADFAAHRLEGTAELTVEQVDPNARRNSVSTPAAFEISDSVQLIEAGVRTRQGALPSERAAPDLILGSKKLTIQFPHCCAADAADAQPRIAYRTAADAKRAAVARAGADVRPASLPVQPGARPSATRSWIPIQSPAIRN